jgi:hypothetical protein
LPTGSAPANSLSATSNPSTATFRARSTSVVEKSLPRSTSKSAGISTGSA